MPRKCTNIRKRKDKRWEGRIKIGNYPNGATKYHSVYGNTYGEVKEKMELYIYNNNYPNITMAKRNEFNEILQKWLSSIKISVKKSTLYKYEYLIERHISPCLGEYKVSDISAILVNTFLDHKFRNGRLNGDGGLSSAYVKTMSYIIKSSIEYAVDEGMCQPLKAKINKPTCEKAKIQILSRYEQKQLQSYINENMDLTGLGVTISLYTGLRIQSNLNNILRTAEQVVSDANSVKGSISDLVSIVSYPKTYNLYEQINAAKTKAQTVHNNAIAYESSRTNDFSEIDRLISQALSIINAQLGKSRIPVVAYQQGSIGSMCDMNQIRVDLQATEEKVKSITENGYFEEDATLSINRESLIDEEGKASREWVQWVAVGFSVAGAIALTVVTAGTAGPLVCAGVGALVGAVTVATSEIADNYVENGTLFKGMDWSEFGKNVLVGAVGGAVSGYLGAISQGSAIKQPIKKGMTALANTLAEEGAKGITATVWETGETIYEVGVAIVDGKPGNEIVSVLNEGLGEVSGEISNTYKNMAVEGAKSFVGGTISGKFDIDTSDKGVWKKIGEKTAESAAEEFAGGMVETVWDVGEAVLDSDSSTTVTSALKDGIKKTTSSVISKSASSVVSVFGEDVVDKIDNRVGKVIGETVNDTIAETTENVVEGVTGRTIDYVYGDEKDAGKILGDIWEDDLKSGRAIAEEAGKSLGKNISDEVHKDDKLYNDLKKIDKDKDGKIEVVQFEDYAVTKQDYDAAVENAGKGAYKDKTVQDILGLEKDTDISTGKERTVSIDMTEKYSSSRKTTDTVTVDGKYTFSKSYYESSMNVAGTEEYGGKTAQEILGIPNDVDVSEDNVTYKRVHNDKIGQGKEVELHSDYGTNATKIHISSMKHETKLEREEKKTINKE